MDSPKGLSCESHIDVGQLTVCCDRPSDLQRELSGLIEGTGLWVFRGQRDAAWCLTPSIERISTKPDIRLTEQKSLAEFRRKAHLFTSRTLPDDSDELSWLSLMRHHGVPTRLLDWTYSPFVALYFALWQEAAAQESAVWALDLRGLQRHIPDDLNLVEALINDPGWSKPELPGASLQDLLNFSAFPKYYGLVSHSVAFQSSLLDVPLTVPVLPRLESTRLSMQSGLFLVNLNYCMSSCASLLRMFNTSEVGAYVRKICFARAHRHEVLRYLEKLNIHGSSLFGDLDGLGHFVRIRREAYPVNFSDPFAELGGEQDS